MYNGWVGRDGFASFLEHIGPKPAPHYTLDRIDNNKGYVPGNVRWATRSEQQTNRRVKAVVVMIAGRTQSLQQWSIETGINTHTLASRYTRGKTGEDLIRPVADGYKRHV